MASALANSLANMLMLTLLKSIASQVFPHAIYVAYKAAASAERSKSVSWR